MSADPQSKYLAPREVWEQKIATVLKSVDPKWIAVDEFTTKALHQGQGLDNIMERAADAGLPPIAAEPALAKLMAFTAYVSSTKHALEIGTLAGLTSIRLAKANPQLHVTTIELHDVYANVARENIRDAGLESQIEVLVGSAVDLLPKLRAEIETGKRQRFGLTFIDADGVSTFGNTVKMQY